MSWFESRAALEADDPFCTTEVVVEPNGDRTVLVARDVIQIHPGNQRRLYPDTIDDDGTVRLDTAGEYVYRPAEDGRRFPTLRERDGFIPYQRISEA